MAVRAFVFAALALVGFGTANAQSCGPGQAAAGAALLRPVESRIIETFGIRPHPLLGIDRMHSGIDFDGPVGGPVRAASSGRVAVAERKGDLGNFIAIEHEGSVVTQYGHLSRIAASPGQCVERGAIIGYIGNSGLSAGPHLHFEVLRAGAYVDPLMLLGDARQQ